MAHLPQRVALGSVQYNIIDKIKQLIKINIKIKIKLGFNCFFLKKYRIMTLLKFKSKNPKLAV